MAALPLLVLALALMVGCGGGSLPAGNTPATGSAMAKKPGEPDWWARGTAAAPSAPERVRVGLSASRSPSGVLLLWEGGLLGDYNNDGEVGFADVNLLVANFSRPADQFTPAAVRLFDLDGVSDPPISFNDVSIFVSQFGLELSGFLVVRRELSGSFVPKSSLLWDVESQVPTEGSTALPSPEGETAFTVAHPGPPPEQRLITWSYLDRTPPAGPVAYVVVPYSASSPPHYGAPSNAALAEATGRRLELATPRSTLAVGEEILVELRIRQLREVFTVNARVRFDPSLVSFVSASPTLTQPDGSELENALPPQVFMVGNLVSSSLVGVNVTTNNPSPDPLTGTVAYLRFLALSPGTANFALVTEGGDGVGPPFLFVHRQDDSPISFAVDPAVSVEIVP